MNVVIKKITASAPSLDSPSTDRRDEIVFSIGKSDIGRVLVARSNIGICATLLGSDAGELRRDLSSRFLGCTLVRDDEAVRDELEKVTRFIETPNEGLDLPLDIRGTRFQRRVWEVLRTVRVGAVITYAALARRIGEPNAVSPAHDSVNQADDGVSGGAGAAVL